MGYNDITAGNDRVEMSLVSMVDPALPNDIMLNFTAHFETVNEGWTVSVDYPE